MKKIILTFFLFLTVFFTHTAFAATTTTKTLPFQSMFYYIPGVSAYASIQMYGDKIDILSPQTYTVDDTGKLKGKISDQSMALITSKNIRLMPLIANQNFNQAYMHTMLNSITAQEQIINSLIAEAKAKNYIGWELDFEHMSAVDRDAYSAFVETAADEFHKNKLLLSVAVLARTSEKPGDLPEGSWDNWAGVYDYKRIGTAADAVTLMAYDMPASTGPVASMDWVKKVTAYARKFIPAKKLSLGIPTYGYVWDTDINAKVKSVSWDRVNELQVNNLYTKQGYDTKIGEAWITYSENGSNYKIWYESEKSFKQKLDFAKAQKLRGVSLWAIGLEPEGIWKNFKKIH